MILFTFSRFKCFCAVRHAPNDRQSRDEKKNQCHCAQYFVLRDHIISHIIWQTLRYRIVT